MRTTAMRARSRSRAGGPALAHASAGEHGLAFEGEETAVAELSLDARGAPASHPRADAELATLEDLSSADRRRAAGEQAAQPLQRRERSDGARVSASAAAPPALAPAAAADAQRVRPHTWTVWRWGRCAS